MDYIFTKLQLADSSNEGRKALIGACLFKLGAGMMFSWGSINLYFYSFYEEIEEDFTMSKASMIFGSMMVVLGLGAVFSMELAQRFGIERFIRTCGIIYILSMYICTFMKSFTAFVTFYTLIGSCAYTMSAIPVLNCLWSHYSKSQSGKVTGLSFFSLSISTILTVFFFTALMNPDNTPPTIQKTEGDQTILLFDSNISSRLQSTMLLINSFQAICLIPGTFLITKLVSNTQTNQSQKIELTANNNPDGQQENNQPFKIVSDEEDYDEEEGQDHQKQLGQKDNSLYSEKTQTGQEITEVIQHTGSVQHYPSVKEGAKSEPFIVVYITGVLNALYITFLAMNFKVYATSKINDDYFLTFVMICSQVAGGFASLSFGHLIDMFSYKKCMLGIQVTIGVFAATIPLIATSKPFLFLWYVVITISSSGLQTIVGPILVKIFGVETGSKLLPIKTTCFFVAIIIAQIINFLVFKYSTYDVALTILGIAIFLGIFLILRLKNTYNWVKT